MLDISYAGDLNMVKISEYKNVFGCGRSV
ncbi:MAG: hypothetical protein RLZZ379_1297, partial [Pseudomonadota bacterium]